jgi:hypothetical protein
MNVMDTYKLTGPALLHSMTHKQTKIKPPKYLLVPSPMAVKDPRCTKHMLRLDRSNFPAQILRKRQIEQGTGNGTSLARRHLESMQPQLKIALPWNQQTRILAYDVVNDDTGKPSHFENVRIFRGGAGATRQRRDRRLENSMTEGQWLSLYKGMAMRLWGDSAYG